MRLGSILELSNSGLPRDQFEYGTRAEFDFVVALREPPNLHPQFAVEFDGPIHANDPDTIRRDLLKNSICRKLGFPLLRIDADFLDEQTGRPLVALLAKSFLFEKSFSEAQEAGDVSPFEPFCYWSVYEQSGDGWAPAFAIDSKARQQMFEFAQTRGRWWVPECITTPIDDAGRQAKSYCLFEIADGEFVVGYAAITDFGFFGGIGAWELVTDLAVASCGERLRLYLDGKYNPSRLSTIAAIRERTTGWIRQGSMSSDMPT